MKKLAALVLGFSLSLGAWGDSAATSLTPWSFETRDATVVSNDGKRVPKARFYLCHKGRRIGQFALTIDPDHHRGERPVSVGDLVLTNRWDFNSDRLERPCSSG